MSFRTLWFPEVSSVGKWSRVFCAMSRRCAERVAAFLWTAALSWGLYTEHIMLSTRVLTSLAILMNASICVTVISFGDTRTEAEVFFRTITDSLASVTTEGRTTSSSAVKVSSSSSSSSSKSSKSSSSSSSLSLSSFPSLSSLTSSSSSLAVFSLMASSSLTASIIEGSQTVISFDTIIFFLIK